jgi:hypothetical protein
VPLSFADACHVRMTKTANDLALLTTDADFQVYRRHGRQVIPAILPREHSAISGENSNIGAQAHAKGANVFYRLAAWRASLSLRDGILMSV